MSRDPIPVRVELEHALLLWALNVPRQTVDQALQSLRAILAPALRGTEAPANYNTLPVPVGPPSYGTLSGHLEEGAPGPKRPQEHLSLRQQRLQVAEEYAQFVGELGREPKVEDLIALKPGLYTQIRHVFSGVRKLRRYLQGETFAAGHAQHPAVKPTAPVKRTRAKAGRRGRLKPPQREEAVRLYQAGKKVHDIAGKFGVSDDCIYRELHKRGVEVGRVRVVVQGQQPTP